MKRIIAAALSVLVGAFGYTIVDQAVEDRVTSLESEVIELREEVSRYHPPYSEQVTTTPASESTTRKKETTTQKKITTTYKQTTNNNVDLYQPLMIGSYLKESSNSLHKFLIREYTDGRFSYISHYNYEPVSFVTRPIITTQPEETQSETVGFSNGYIIYDGNINDDPVDNFVTTDSATVAEYYINITESSAQITNITEDVSYKYSYDKDYSSVSKPITHKTTFVTVLCKGYTDPALSGKKIILNTTIDSYYYNTSIPKEIISNTINSDGSFEYKAVYSTTVSVRGIDEYSFTSIKIA